MAGSAQDRGPTLTVLKKDGHIVRADPERQAALIEACKANGYEIGGEAPAADTPKRAEPKKGRGKKA